MGNVIDIRSYFAERVKPYNVRMSCLHVEVRMMREATAGIPWIADEDKPRITADAPCEACRKATEIERQAAWEASAAKINAEREAAARASATLQATAPALAEAPPKIAPRRKGAGAKYREGATLAEIKRGIVGDIADAVKRGELPKGATYAVSVRKGRGSMCRPDVTITADGFAFEITHPDKLEAQRAGRGNAYHGPWRSVEAQTVGDKLEGIANAYGYDNSDTQSDYFDYAFGVHVAFPAKDREYLAAEAEADRRRRA